MSTETPDTAPAPETWPTAGGSYVRNPETGELERAAPQE